MLCPLSFFKKTKFDLFNSSLKWSELVYNIILCITSYFRKTTSLYFQVKNFLQCCSCFRIFKTQDSKHMLSIFFFNHMFNLCWTFLNMFVSDDQQVFSMCVVLIGHILWFKFYIYVVINSRIQIVYNQPFHVFFFWEKKYFINKSGFKTE